MDINNYNHSRGICKAQRFLLPRRPGRSTRARNRRRVRLRQTRKIEAQGSKRSFQAPSLQVCRYFDCKYRYFLSHLRSNSLFLLGAVKSQRQGKFKMHLAFDDRGQFLGRQWEFHRVPVPPNKEKKAGNGWVYKLGWGRRSRILLVKSASGVC